MKVEELQQNFRENKYPKSLLRTILGPEGNLEEMNTSTVKHEPRRCWGTAEPKRTHNKHTR